MGVRESTRMRRMRRWSGRSRRYRCEERNKGKTRGLLQSPTLLVQYTGRSIQLWRIQLPLSSPLPSPLLPLSPFPSLSLFHSTYEDVGKHLGEIINDPHFLVDRVQSRDLDQPPNARTAQVVVVHPPPQLAPLVPCAAVDTKPRLLYDERKRQSECVSQMN